MYQNSVLQNWYVQVIILAVPELLLSMHPVLHQINVTHDSSVALSVAPVKKHVDLVLSEPWIIDAGIRRISVRHRLQLPTMILLHMDLVINGVDMILDLLPQLQVLLIGAILKMVLSGHQQEAPIILVHHDRMSQQ